MYKAMVAGWVAGLVAGWVAGWPAGRNPPPPPAGWRSSLDRLMLVNAKVKTVGDRLLTKNLDSVPSSFLYLEPASPCPCSAWLADDRVSQLHGHAFFRDPGVLRDLCPGVDVSVFAQNFKNTSIPSWSQFHSQVHASVASLCAALPDHRSESAGSLSDTLVDTCKNIYDHRVQAYPRTVYGPHISAQKRKLPSFAVVAVFDKGTSVPNFSCIQLWHELRRRTLVNSPRFAEVSRFHRRVDRCGLLAVLAPAGFPAHLDPG